MKPFIALTLMALATTTGTQATSSNGKVLGFTNVPGFFMQDQPETNASNFDFVSDPMYDAANQDLETSLWLSMLPTGLFYSGI
jgi:hypothetical protein